MGLKEAKPKTMYKILKNQVGSFVILFIFGSMCLDFLIFVSITEHNNEIVWKKVIMKCQHNLMLQLLK